MRCGVFLLLLTSLPIGCGDESSSLSEADSWPDALDDEGTVLRWDVTFPGGHERATLKRNGRLEYELLFQRLHEEERTMSEADMTLLRDDLLGRGCCNLRGPWRDDESMVSLQVRMPGFTCDLAMPTLFYEMDPNVRRLCDQRLGSEWSAARPPIGELIEIPWDIYIGPDKRAAPAPRTEADYLDY